MSRLIIVAFEGQRTANEVLSKLRSLAVRLLGLV